jgi:hypothetical protein
MDNEMEEIAAELLAEWKAMQVDRSLATLYARAIARHSENRGKDRLVK